MFGLKTIRRLDMRKHFKIKGAASRQFLLTPSSFIFCLLLVSLISGCAPAVIKNIDPTVSSDYQPGRHYIFSSAEINPQSGKNIHPSAEFDLSPSNGNGANRSVAVDSSLITGNSTLKRARLDNPLGVNYEPFDKINVKWTVDSDVSGTSLNPTTHYTEHDKSTIIVCSDKLNSIPVLDIKIISQAADPSHGVVIHASSDDVVTATGVVKLPTSCKRSTDTPIQLSYTWQGSHSGSATTNMVHIPANFEKSDLFSININREELSGDGTTIAIPNYQDQCFGVTVTANTEINGMEVKGSACWRIASP